MTRFLNTSASNSMATPTEGAPTKKEPKIKTFEIYRWVIIIIKKKNTKINKNITRNIITNHSMYTHQYVSIHIYIYIIIYT